MSPSNADVTYKSRLGLYSRATLVGEVTEVDDSIWSLNWLVEAAMAATGMGVDRSKGRYKPLEFEGKMMKFWKVLEKKFPLLHDRIKSEVSLMAPRRVSDLKTHTEPADIVAKFVRKIEKLD
jgi:hypothetical protein